MNASSKRIEWRSLTATTVVPVPCRVERHGGLRGRLRRPRRMWRGDTVREYLASRYPFDLVGRRVVHLRGIGAVAIIPPGLPPDEEDRPVPAVLIDRFRWIRRPTVGDRTLRFGTAQGYDYYRLRSGRLVACWSSTAEALTDSDVVDIDPGRAIRRGTLHARTSRHSLGGVACGALLSVAALTVQVWPVADAPIAAIAPSRADTSGAKVTDPTGTLRALARVIPDLRLSALSVARNSCRWSVMTESPHAEITPHLGLLSEHTVTVRVADGTTILTVEEER